MRAKVLFELILAANYLETWMNCRNQFWVLPESSGSEVDGLQRKHSRTQKVLEERGTF